MPQLIAHASVDWSARLAQAAAEATDPEALSALRSEAEAQGRPRLAAGLARLGAVRELAECLDAEDPDAARAARDFAHQALLDLARLGDDLRSLEALAVERAKLAGERWGDLLALIEDPADASFDEPEPESDEDPTAALRTFFGLALPVQPVATATDLPEPDPVAAPIADRDRSDDPTGPAGRRVASAEADHSGRPNRARALARLAGIAELAEVLAADDPDAARLAASAAEAGRSELIQADEAGALALAERCEADWGEYLALLDGDAPAPPAPTAADLPRFEEPFAPTSEAEGEADAGALRALFGLAPAADPDPPQSLPDEVLEAFLIDVAAQQEELERIVLGLRPGVPAPEELREARRKLHTLKGAAGSVGMMELHDYVHALEDRIESAGDVPDEGLIGAIHAGLDYLDGAMGGMRGDPSPDAASFDAAPTGATSATTAPAAGPPDGMLHVSAARVDELLDLVAELLTRRGRWAAAAAEMTGFGAVARQCRNRTSELIDRLRDAMARPRTMTYQEANGFGGESDGDPFHEITRRLFEQAEDVGVLGSTARAAALPLADDGDVLGQVTLRLWETLQAMRLEPMRRSLQKLARAAVAAARTPGEEKEVEVIVIGEETGADKTVQERVGAALLHVVRNAVGHGIEPPEERLRAKKPRAGRVTLGASNEGNTLVVTIADDGRGLDYGAIERKAKQKGLLAADASPSVEELNRIIFLPGFSTAARTTGLSGRGVGMDEVAGVVSQLQGNIAISSQPGRGTTFTVRLPARFALETAVVVWVDGQLFALPVMSILSSTLFDAADRTCDGDVPLLHYKGRRAPLIDARLVLGTANTPPPPAPKVLILETGEDELTALMVDAIEGPRDLVVKPLPALIAGHPLISGTGLSTAGAVIFLLDPQALARRKAGAASLGAWLRPVRREQAGAVLVVDDSLSVRRVNARVLRGKGFEVDEAADGLEALQKLRSRTYRLILSDLEMPRMDGFELLTELGRSGMLAAAPVVVASTKSDQETRRRVLQLGARSFVAKPIGPEVWGEVIDPLLQPTAS